MKPTKQTTRIFAISFFMACCMNMAQAQLTYVKASNCDGYYYISPGATFTWSGGLNGDLCHGFGTIQRYDNGTTGSKYIGNVVNGKKEGYGAVYYANGNKYYEGYWKDGKKNGYGTLYNDYGNIEYKGYFENDSKPDYYALESLGQSLASNVIDNLFDGGTNKRYSIVKVVYNRSNKLTELHVKITFNGNIFKDNFYRCTLVIKNDGTYAYADFVDYNDLAGSYLEMKFSLYEASLLMELFKKLAAE